MIGTLSRRIVIGLVCASSLSFATLAWSGNATTQPVKSMDASKQFDTMNHNMGESGITFTQTGTTINILIDEQKVIKAAPALSEQNIIVKLGPQDIIKAPLAISVYSVGIAFTAGILAEVYDTNKSADKLHVDAYIMPMDGKDKQLCYSFDYNRKIYSKLDWNRTTANDFTKITPGFKFSQWCTNVLQQEANAYNKK